MKDTSMYTFSRATDSRANDLQRIRLCLERVAELVRSRGPRQESVDYSASGDPCTSLDRDINRTILESLPAEGEGWLSEESEDSPERHGFSRLWVVDPIDGTREFVEGIPEWCVSIGLVEDHAAVAGGVLNPSTGEMFLGSVETGLEVVGLDGSGRHRENSASASMLVSRREHREGKWKTFEQSGLAVIPVGSIAYRLAHVAAGYADATCTFQTRSEWDVAGGVALMLAAGGRVQMRDGSPVLFNQTVPKLHSIFAFGRNCSSSLPKMCGFETS
jgi:myo-inositol-1(or 4)-monophosphatase